MSRRIPSDLITQSEAARIRGVTPEAISMLIKRGRLTPIEVAGHIYVRQSEIENFKKKPAGRPPNQYNSEIASKKKIIKK